MNYYSVENLVEKEVWVISHYVDTLKLGDFAAGKMLEKLMRLFMKNYVFEYLPQFHYLCVQNCICQMLSFLGCKHSHQYMNCALEFFILPKNEENGWFSFVQRKMGDLIISPLKQCVKVKTVLSPTNAWRINRESLDNKKIFIAIVDVYYLYYRREFNKIHGAHAVIVTGYDTDVINIIDWYEPYFFQGNIDRRDFLKARSSSNPKNDNPYSGWPIYNKWIDIEFNFNELSPKECLFNNISYTLQKRYNTDSNNNMLFGIDALNYLLNISIKHHANQSLWKNMHNDMFGLWRLYNLFLTNFSEVAHSYANIKNFLPLFETYNKLFQDILYIILKQSVRESERTFERFSDMFSRFIELTSSLYAILEKISFNDKNLIISV